MNNFSRNQYEKAPNFKASSIQESQKQSSASRSNLRIVQIIIIFIAISFIMIFLNMINQNQNDSLEAKSNFHQQNNQRNSNKGISNKKNTTQKESNGQQIFQENDLNRNNDDTKKTIEEKDSSQKQEQDTTIREQKEDGKTEQNEQEKEKTELICNEGQFFSKENCSSICPQGYFRDEIDRLCKPNILSSGQVKLFKMEGSNDKSPERGFYEILSSRSYAQNKEGRNGFFFFNKENNEGFNFLNSAFGSTSLNRLLENVDGMIVTLPGSDQLFIDNETNLKNLMLLLISQNSNITSWYTCGIFELGGFTSLRYLDLMGDHLKGSVALDPDYMKQSSNLQKAVGRNLKNYDLLNQFKLKKQALSSMNVMIVEKNQSSQLQFSLNLQSFIGLSILYYERDRKLSQNNSVVETIFFPTLEQFISSASKIAITEF